MTGPRELLEARLRANLDDEQAWRVYGDLLLDQGDARGELIMLSLLQREQPQLEERVRQLTAELRAQAPLTARGTWRHGFLLTAKLELGRRVSFEPLRTILSHPAYALVHHIELEVDPHLPEHELDKLGKLDWSRIRSLRYADQPYGDAIASALAHATTCLEALDLPHTQLGRQGLRALAQLAKRGSLRRLWLQRNAIAGKGFALLVPKLAGLELLDLRYVALQEADARLLATAPALANLHTLRLDLHRLDVNGVQALADSTTLPRHITRLFRGVAELRRK